MTPDDHTQPRPTETFANPVDPTAAYTVPVDPIELLQCDSCQ